VRQILEWKQDGTRTSADTADASAMVKLPCQPAPGLLDGKDAQEWVSRGRREGTENG